MWTRGAISCGTPGLVFSENVAFNSPSAAASVVMARASNGRKNWQLEATGETYAQWQDAKLTASGADVADAAGGEEG